MVAKNGFYKTIFLTTFISALTTQTFAQQNTKSPSDYFRSPLDIPLVFSGNFGELRSNHFHSGLDIKTDGVEGKKIYAVADGYVSRIKISPFGYGKAIYITHPNGYVSVYAHLQKYNDSIQNYIKEAQYLNETFEIELFPKPDELIIKKGSVIAFSGNTGGSGGPHLHFEIREEKTEKPVNPLLFGFGISDKIAPTIKEVVIYPLDNSASINNSGLPKKIPLVPNKGTYTAAKPAKYFVNGAIGFGIAAFDQVNGSTNHVGIYSTELKVDGETVFYSELEKFAFEESRYINCHIDYSEYKKNKTRYERCFISPNNQLSIYKTHKNKGIIHFKDDLIHKVEYILKDFHGNVSRAMIEVQSKSKSDYKESAKVSSKFNRIFRFDEENIYKDDNISLQLPSGILYENLNFEYYISDKHQKAITHTHHIHNEYTPVHSNYNLAIKIDSLPVHMKRKALVVGIDSKGALSAQGGDLRDSFIYCNPKTLGAFTIMIDSVSPVINPLNIANGKNMATNTEIRVKISDNLSGIKSYRGTIDGQWILMEYDAKSDLLFHQLEKGLTKGKHLFKLEVKDNRGNVSFYQAEFVR